MLNRPCCFSSPPPLFRRRLFLVIFLVCSSSVIFAQSEVDSGGESSETGNEAEPVVVSATRTDIPLDRSPSSTSEIDSQDMEIKQTERVSDALREVPGLSVVQTGPPGQLTSVFARGLRSEQTQVLFDGVPFNQGLQQAFNFADLTTDNIDRIEVVRGPSIVYGPSAMAGVIQIFTKQGESPPSMTLTSEGGSYDTFRESIASNGQLGQFDYSLGGSRIDTDNARPNSQYRNTAAVADLGWSPEPQMRFGTVLLYSLSDAGSPNSIFTPRPVDNLLTERWLIAPHLDIHVLDWWDQRLVVSFDHERQINDPNQDGFVGPTRALFERTQVDFQNNIRPCSWLTLTSGFFYSNINDAEERPFILFPPDYISDHPQDAAGFAEATLDMYNFLLVAGGRYDSFNKYGDVWTYRVAGSYKIDQTDTTLHASVATGFDPPSPQDKIFGNNPNLKPEHDFGWDIGAEQRLWDRRITVGATYFHSDLSELIDFNDLFQAVNIGAAETQGVETEMVAMPVRDLAVRASYTYLDAYNTSATGQTQPLGARLARRPRQEVYLSASYLWLKKLRTTLAAKWVNARERENFGAPNIDEEDYNFVNFAAEYEINPHLSLYGRIDNLTNEHYAEVYGFPALGRAFYGGVKLRF